MITDEHVEVSLPRWIMNKIYTPPDTTLFVNINNNEDYVVREMADNQYFFSTEADDTSVRQHHLPVIHLPEHKTTTTRKRTSTTAFGAPDAPELQWQLLQQERVHGQAGGDHGNAATFKKRKYNSEASDIEMDKYAFMSYFANKHTACNLHLLSLIYEVTKEHLTEQTLDVISAALKCVYFKTLENSMTRNCSAKKNKFFKRSMKSLLLSLPEMTNFQLDTCGEVEDEGMELDMCD